MTVKIGTRIVSQEDTDTKTIALGGQFLMGFTGLARIDSCALRSGLAACLMA
jgi:hypothetical protein